MHSAFCFCIYYTVWGKGLRNSPYVTGRVTKLLSQKCLKVGGFVIFNYIKKYNNEYLLTLF